MRAVILMLLLCASTLAWPQTIATQDSVSPAVRSEIAHVRDIITANDRRYEQRFVAQEKAVGNALIALEKATAQAQESAKEAVETAQIASEKRLDSVNEFREQLRDQAETFMRLREARAKFETIEIAINRLQERIDKSDGSRSGADALWGYFVAALTLMVVIIGVVLGVRRMRLSEESPRLHSTNGSVS